MKRYDTYSFIMALALGFMGAGQTLVEAAVNPTDIAGMQMERDRRDIEREQVREQIAEDEAARKAKVEQGDSTSTENADTEIHFELKRVEWNPSAILNQDEIQAITDGYIGRQITAKDLLEMTDKITALYREKGYMTCGAMLNRRIHDGVATIRLVEGKTEAVSVSGNRSTKTSYKVSGLTAGTSYKYKVRAYRKVNGVTYWGTSSAAVTLTTESSQSDKVYKAYQSFIVGNPTSAQIDLVEKDLESYISKKYSYMTYNSGIYAFIDKDGNLTNDNLIAVDWGNATFASGVGFEDYITEYYVFNYDLDTLTKKLIDELYDYADANITGYWNESNRYDSFNVIVYKEKDNHAIKYNTGKDLPMYTLVFGLSNADWL